MKDRNQTRVYAVKLRSHEKKEQPLKFIDLLKKKDVKIKNLQNYFKIFFMKTL